MTENQTEVGVYFTIEVNVARKGFPSNWKDLEDDNGDSCTFTSVEDARAILDEEGRGENARIMCFENGIGSPVSA